MLYPNHVTTYHNYRHYRLPLFFGREEKGSLHIDVHLLSTANAKAEREALKIGMRTVCSDLLNN